MSEILFQHEEQVQAFFAGINNRDVAAIEAALEEMTSSEAVRALLMLKEEDRTATLELIGPTFAADLVEEIPTEQAAEIVEQLDEAKAAEIIEEMNASDAVDIIQDLDAADAELILNQMDSEDAAAIRKLARYDEDVAGGLMTPDCLKFHESQTVADVIAFLVSDEEEFETYQTQHPYVVDHREKLVGVVSLRKILGSRRSMALSELMAPADSVSLLTPLEDLEDVFDDHPYLSIPVTDGRGRLVGAVTREAVDDATIERVERDALKTSGLVEDELRSMPTLLRARRRLSWLTVNIGLNILAASIISSYEETLAAVIALAVFLPMVSDMSGCSGNQAVAVSLRELSIGVTRPSDLWRIWRKEVSVGLVNGLALGVLIGLVAWLWKGNPWIGLVVGLALALNTLVAVSVGGLVPLVLKARQIDPAVASGPMLTTITDMVGFFLVLSIATALMPQLV
ncbi:MAG: magnesium transporter [Xanthomonadales bacterium]|nr:magnesium transporter [Xanthomonadales bacterium]